MSIKKSEGYTYLWIINHKPVSISKSIGIASNKMWLVKNVNDEHIPEWLMLEI